MMMMQEKGFSGQVVVFAFPFGTHLTPLLSIINRVANLSPDTHFSFFCTQKANNSLVSSKIEPNVKLCELWDGIPQGFVFSPSNHLEEIEMFMKAAPESFREGIKAAVAETGREITCLVTDAFFGFAAEMAEEMRVPWFACWTAAAISVSAHFYTDFIRDTFGGGAGKEERLNVIEGMSKVKIRDLPEGILFGNMDSIISQMLHKMGKTLPKADAVFINSFEELDPIITNHLKHKFNQLLCTGPFNLISQLSSSTPPDPYGCIQWLHNQKPQSAAYVSFGSVATPPPHELSALAEALEASQVPFVWSLKDHAKTNLPNGFMDRTKSQGLVVPWTPQIQVLSHSSIGVFVTHCGWNSVLESIEGGVPMICRPFFGDQRLNGRMVQDVLEIGVQVEDGILTKNGVLDGLDIVFAQEKGKKLRENVTLLKQLAETAIQPQGSSYKNVIALAQLMTNIQQN